MKILIAGLGGIGQRHARNLRAILGSNLELLAWRVRGLSQVITPKLEADTAGNVEREYNIKVFDDLSKALAERPQIAFIANPTNLHIPTAQACAEASCDLFIEKPASHNLTGVSELLRLSEDRDLVTMVGYQLRFHPCYRALRDLLRTVAIGRVVAVRATVGEYLPGWHPYEDYRRMYAARADMGGGVVLSQIHEFDYLYSLFGLPKRIFSLGGHWSDLEIDVEDVVSTLMEFSTEQGLIAAHLHQDYLQRPASRRCEVIGDKGKAVADFAALTFLAYGSDGRVVANHDFAGFDRNQLFLDQTKQFLECVERREKPAVDLRAGIQSLRMALAAKESIASGMPVELGAEF